MKKSEIQKILKSKNRTDIFKLVKKLGVEPTKDNVYDFIKDNFKSNTSFRTAYLIAYSKKLIPYNPKNNFRQPIFEAIQYAKYQKLQGFSQYAKILFIGNDNIYWCSPSYGHSDYNKSRAFKNTDKNRKLAKLINKFLGYENI